MTSMEATCRSLMTSTALNSRMSSWYTFTPGWFARYAAAASFDSSTAATILNLASRLNPAQPSRAGE